MVSFGSLNVLTGVNDTISGVTFEEGYWSFNMISKKLRENNIQLERNRYNNTCKIRSPSQINLLNFGSLLGFPVYIPGLNLGLRYVTLRCNCVDTDKKFDSNGKRSKVNYDPRNLGTNLNSSVTFYNNIHSSVSILNGEHNVFEFDVNTNIGNKVGLTVMFELYLE